MKYDKNGLAFGMVDTNNGLASEGYIDKNGEMRFKKIPWYKKLFSKEPSKIEFIGVTEVYSQLIWSNKKNYFETAVYRKYNPYTNKTQCIYTNIRGCRTFYFDIAAYEKTGQLIIET